MLDLNDYFYFVQVVDRGGFTAAGRALRMPKSTLSYRMQQLESALGVRLLNRTSRHFGPTQAGEEFYRHALLMVRAAEEAEESKSLAEQLEESMQDLKRDVGGQLEDSPIGLFYRLMDRRWFVWECFSVDAVYRPTKKTDQLTEQLKGLLEQPIQLADWSMNLAELEFWGLVIDRRGVAVILQLQQVHAGNLGRSPVPTS